MAKRYEDMADEERGAVLEKACQRASEVLSDVPYLLVGCTLGPDGLPNTAQPVSPNMTDEQIVNLIQSLSGAFSSAQPEDSQDRKAQEAVLVAANAKADRKWREMRNNLDALSRVAASYPTETAGDRLVRDCIFLVFNQVLEGMKRDN